MRRPRRPRHAPRAALGAMLIAYMVYAAVRILRHRRRRRLRFDRVLRSMQPCSAFALFASQPRSPLLAGIGSGSYFIYLWHIFIVMALRDHASLRQFGGVAELCRLLRPDRCLSVSLALLAVRQVASPRLYAGWGHKPCSCDTPCSICPPNSSDRCSSFCDDRMDACRRRTHAWHHNADDGDARTAADWLSGLVVAICAALFRALPGRQRGVALLSHRKFCPAGIQSSCRASAAIGILLVWLSRPAPRPAFSSPPSPM